MRRHLVEAFWLSAGFTALSYLFAMQFHWIEKINHLEAFAVFTSYACTWLCVRQRRINYPIGAISTAAYAVLFWQADLLASALLNAYLTPALLYGWFRWRKDAQGRPVSLVALRWWPVYLVVTAAAYAGAVWLSTALGGHLAWTDSVILTVTILAQFLLDNKKLETWGFWVIVNLFAIYTYWQADLYLVVFQYVLFLLNTIIGFVAWERSRRAQSIRPDEGHAADHGSSAADPVR